MPVGCGGSVVLGLTWPMSGGGQPHRGCFRGALLDGYPVGHELLPVFLVEDAAGIACMELPEVSIRPRSTAPAIAPKGANLAVMQAGRPIVQDLPEGSMAADLEKWLLPNRSHHTMREVHARGDQAVGFDADVGPAGPAAAEVLRNHAGLGAAA